MAILSNFLSLADPVFKLSSIKNRHSDWFLYQLPWWISLQQQEQCGYHSELWYICHCVIHDSWQRTTDFIWSSIAITLPDARMAKRQKLASWLIGGAVLMIGWWGKTVTYYSVTLVQCVTTLFCCCSAVLLCMFSILQQLEEKKNRST